MIPLRSEKQVRLYGQLLVNFANARNSDEAYEELIKGIQRAFNFSTNFVKQSEKILPSLREFRSSLSKKENVLINLIQIERNIKHDLNDQFGLISRNLTDYNSEENTLTFQDIILYGGAYEGEIEVDAEFTRPYSEHIKDIDPHDWEMMKPCTFQKVKQLMKVGNAKRRFKQNISEDRYSELKSLIKTYENITKIHKRISLYQKTLRTALNDIVEGKNLYNNNIFKHYLNTYRSYCQLDLILQPDGSFCYVSKFLKEEYYLKYKDSIFDPLFDRRSEPPLNLPITYSLIEFLLNYDRRKLKYCPYCNKFFVAKSINRKTRCYSRDCEKAYQRDKKRKQRDKDPVKYY